MLHSLICVKRHRSRSPRAAGWEIANISIQIVSQRPRFLPRKAEAEAVMSEVAGAPVSVSATTTDHLGFTGRNEGMAAIATALLSTLEGAGDTISTTAVQIISLWLVQLPLCWILPRSLGLGSSGIWLALLLTQCTNAAALFWRFRVGRWQRTRI